MASNIYESGDYLSNNPGWHTEDSSWKVQEIIKMINRNHLAPSSLAEVGCGFGGILAKLSSQMCSVDKIIGYDISDYAIEQAKLRYSEHAVEFINKDILDQDVKFDCLLCIDVVEHIENPYEFLRKLKSKSELKIFHFPLPLAAISQD